MEKQIKAYCRVSGGKILSWDDAGIGLAVSESQEVDIEGGLRKGTIVPCTITFSDVCGECGKKR